MTGVPLVSVLYIKGVEVTNVLTTCKNLNKLNNRTNSYHKTWRDKQVHTDTVSWSRKPLAEISLGYSTREGKPEQELSNSQRLSVDRLGILKLQEDPAL
jgi:hypothetical protein